MGNREFNNPRAVFYTLGTSNRTEEEFLEILNHYQLEMIVDVRRFPASRFAHFRQEKLAELVISNGGDYLYLGKELGGYRRGGYQEYTRTNEFQQAIQTLEELSGQHKLAVLCCERFPWRCHRRFIGKAMADKGWRVIHIIDTRRVWEPGRRKKCSP